MTVEQAQHLSAGPESWQGSVESIHIARGAGEPMESLDEVRAVPGRGLEGDRYFTATGHYSGRASVGGREVTLIEREAVKHLDGGIITSLGKQLDIELAAGEARRNIMTSRVPLNHLIGREFWVGEVLMRGTRLCEPCNYLESLTKPGVRMALTHHGGLRANILSEGVIRVGDTVRVVTIRPSSNAQSVHCGAMPWKIEDGRPNCRAALWATSGISSAVAGRISTISALRWGGDRQLSSRAARATAAKARSIEASPSSGSMIGAASTSPMPAPVNSTRPAATCSSPPEMTRLASNSEL